MPLQIHECAGTTKSHRDKFITGSGRLLLYGKDAGLVPSLLMLW